MKKLIVLFAIMIAANSLFAQLSFGPKIGYTANTLTTDWSIVKEEAKGSKMHFGVFLRTGGEKAYLQPEIIFMTKSGTLRENLTSAIFADHTLDLKTIDIPILIGYKVLDMKIASLRVFGGPVASLLINSEETISGGTAEAIFTTENFKNASWNVNFGVGVDVLMFTLDVRYDYSITSLYSDPTEEFNLRSNAFLVSLGWKIF